MEKQGISSSPLTRISRFIVKNRIWFLAVFLLLSVGAGILIPKVSVNYDITKYLPEHSETRRALDLMADEFTSTASADVMVKNISAGEAAGILTRLSAIEGIAAVRFENTPEHFKDGKALFQITMKEGGNSPATASAVEEIKEALSGYSVAYRGDAVSETSFQDTMMKEMTIILLVSVSIILVVLLLTSKSYLEIPVFLVVFIVAAVINMGTNYFLGEISFITNSIAVVLQLALAIDYAIIFSHRYAEERAGLPAKEAAASALAKAIPAILSSALTTVSGLVALMFMQFRIGFDIGLVLAKGIVISFLTVFLMMPALLVFFSKAIDRTRHRSFVPKMTFLGKFNVKTRKVVPVIAVALIATACVLQSFSSFIFADTSYPRAKGSASEDSREIEETFGKSNLLAVIVPKGDPEKERSLLTMISSNEIVSGSMGLASIAVKDGIGVYDKLNFSEFAAFAEVSPGTAQFAYFSYGLAHPDSGFTTDNLAAFEVAVADMVDYLAGDNGLPLDEATKATLAASKAALDEARKLFEGEHYSRLLFHINGGVEDAASFDLIRSLRLSMKDYYAESYLLGDTVSYFDISESFFADNVKINVMTVAFILLILLVNFRSVSIPIILILTIQGSIWINFAVNVVFSTPLLFMSYLIVSAIHMGATIDYAILLTGRYLEKRKIMEKKTAMIETISTVFPAVITSAAILTIAGFVVGGFSTIAYVFTIGNLLGRGTLISLVMVLVVLPQLLLIFDKVIAKTTFSSLFPRRKRNLQSLSEMPAKSTADEMEQQQDRK